MTVAVSTGIRMRVGIRMGMGHGMGIGRGGYGYACESVVQGDETCHLISLFASAEFIHRRCTVFCFIFLTYLLSLMEIATRTRHFFPRPTIPPVPVRSRLTSPTLMSHITVVHDCRYHPAPARDFFLTALTLQKSRGYRSITNGKGSEPRIIATESFKPYGRFA